MARVLVATDSVGDAKLILGLLREDFERVRSSTHKELWVQEFEDFRPDVLVLAFDRLDKAQGYYLGLYRLGGSPQQHPHRTIVLCNKNEVRAAFELCKSDYFDDYVLYWPHTHDGPRLAMSIWIASRDLIARQSDSPQRTELLAHARHLGKLEKTLHREFADGEQQVAIARSSLLQLEHQLADASDEFSNRLAHGESEGWVEVRDPGALAREIEQLKNQQRVQTRQAGTNGVEPMSAWASKLRQEIEPVLAGTRVLTERVRKIKSLVMVVDDDELTQKLIARTLDPEAYEMLFVSDSSTALAQLRRTRPDIILMDIQLPGVDGVSLTRQIKASPHLSDIPIIMMTGDSRRETLKSSIEVGAADFVVKPFTHESLTTKLEKYLLR